MSTTTRTEAWVRVTRHDPCPKCEKDRWCKVSPDGAVAMCMRNFDGAFKLSQLKTGEPYALHSLRDDRPYEPQAIKFTMPPTPEEDAGFDVVTARAVYAVVADHCAADLPAEVRAELVRRFGPEHGPQIAERFRIGYCNSPQLVQALEVVGRRTQAIAAGVLRPNTGQAVGSLGGRITIPYTRDGAVMDIRGSGIKGRGETKEMSLPGGYAERGVSGKFFNMDALDTLPKGGTIQIAGGAWKAMALAICGLPTLGTRGEGEMSDAQIAELVAAEVGAVVINVDAEDPKEGDTLSMGRKLALHKAERLEAAGIRVLIAEPHREPGTAKVDPDSLLRDFGPGMVRAYALSAIPVAAWRVALGVAPASISDEAAAEIETLRQRCAKQQRTLSNVLHIRNNGNIKAERDTLTASVLHMAAAQEAGHHTPSGRIRQPLYTIAGSVGKKNPAVSKHLKLGAEEGLFRRELLEEVLVREVDKETGQSRNILRLKDADGRVVEECPAEPVLGAALAYRHATGEEATGAYYVTPLHETTEIFDILVTLDPDRGSKKAWGGKREACPRCKSLRRRTVVTCEDCGLEFSNKVDGPDELPTDEAGNIAPTPIEDLAAAPPTYPVVPRANVREDEDDEADTWDPHFCNHPGCAARLDPALHTRYCWQHRQVGLAPEAPPVRLPVGGAPALDREIVEDTARKWSLAAIDEHLERYRERWATGEDTAQLRMLLTDWRAIRVARVAYETARPVPVGAD